MVPNNYFNQKLKKKNATTATSLKIKKDFSKVQQQMKAHL